MAGNSPSGYAVKHADEYYFAKLPRELRERLQNGPYDWSSCWTLSTYRKLLKRWPHKMAVQKVCEYLDAGDADMRRKFYAKA